MFRQSLFFVLVVAFISICILDASAQCTQSNSAAAGGQGQSSSSINTGESQQSGGGQQSQTGCEDRKKRSAEEGERVSIEPEETLRKGRILVMSEGTGFGQSFAGSTCGPGEMCSQSSS